METTRIGLAAGTEFVMPSIIISLVFPRLPLMMKLAEELNALPKLGLGTTPGDSRAS